MTTPYLRAQSNQRAAADPATSVFVTANAGSGKTKVLVDRIARLLLAGAAPSAFLCITFTKAAAAEMQRRLFERLGAWCVMDDDRLREQFADLGEPEPSGPRLAEARALFARALETPGGLRIQTIHGFCERLIARFPLEAGVAPGFDIAEEARSRALIELAWADAAGLPALRQPIVHLGARFDAMTFQRLRDTLAARRAELRSFVEERQGIEGALRALRDRHGEHESPEAIAAAALADVDWSLLRELAPILRESGGDDAEHADRVRAALDARSLERLCEIFLTGKGERRKQIGKKKLVAKHQSLFDALDAMSAPLLAARKRVFAAERALDATAALAAGYFLADAYEAAKGRAGALDFEDLIGRALHLLDNAAAAPWVLYKLDGGLSHILIDEGQDTSPAQWRLVAPLQREFFAGEGARAQARTVFAVGDPKQSIYSFQGADPAQFLGEARNLETRALAAGRTFVAPSLEMSFRSTPEVLRVVDATFAELPLAAEPQGSEIMRHDAHRDAHVGRVEWWPLAPRQAKAEASAWDVPLDNEQEATAVAGLCRALASEVKGWIEEGHAVWDGKVERPMRPGDVLALVRARGAIFRQLLKAMKRAGLPVAGADRMILKDEIAVQDLLAAARVALNPGDDLTLATLLKSPWIGLVDDDRDIFPLAHGRARGERVIDRLRASTDPHYAQARALVEDLVAHAGAHPHTFFSRMLERLDASGRSGWELMLARLGQEARDPAEELLSRALGAGRSGAATLQHFIALIESDAAAIKRETEQGEDAVRVMTVHGAKGLEAPVVLLADTTGAARPPQTDPVIFTRDGPIIPVRKEIADDVAIEAKRLSEEAARLEHNRLLYVAMTRARDRLIVCGHERGNVTGGAAPDSWWTLVKAGMERADAQEVETPLGKGLAVGAVRRVGAAQTPAKASITLPEWARRPLAPEAGMRAALAPSHMTEGPVLSPRGAGLERFRRGALIHGLLQRLPDVAPARRAEVASGWLKARGLDEETARAYAGEALRVIEDARFAEVFGPGSRAEAPIVATLDDGTLVRGVIDRMLVREDAVLMLDYKTDRPPPKTVDKTPPRIMAQMAAYRAAVQRIFPGRAIHAALLWTDGPMLMQLPEALLASLPPADSRT
jgi:ATP-dependent helicase/nuclease subunit A